MEDEKTSTEYMKRITSYVCHKNDLGLKNNLRGGAMLEWLDNAAYIYAKKVTGEPNLVTLRFGEIFFKRPVSEGEIVDFYCFKTKIGNTSVSFKIEARVNDLVVFTTDSTFVAIDDRNKKKVLDLNIRRLEKERYEQLKLLEDDKKEVQLEKFE